MSEQQADNQPGAPSQFAGMDPETIAAISMAVSEFGEALLGQLELLARVNLARAFIGPAQTANAGRAFDAPGFERAWAYMTGETYETTPQQPSNTP